MLGLGDIVIPGKSYNLSWRCMLLDIILGLAEIFEEIEWTYPFFLSLPSVSPLYQIEEILYSLMWMASYKSNASHGLDSFYVSLGHQGKLRLIFVVFPCIDEVVVVYLEMFIVHLTFWNL